MEPADTFKPRRTLGAMPPRPAEWRKVSVSILFRTTQHKPVTPIAPVAQSRSRTIPAPVSQVWERLVAIPSWPDWHPLCTQMTAPTPVQLGTRFRYANNGTRIAAEVIELVPTSTFAFVGRAWGVTARNQWRLTPIDSQHTDVCVQEEMRGLLPWLMRGPFNRGLGEGLERWLESLERSLSSHA